jgi:hypothetical protein
LYLGSDGVEFLWGEGGELFYDALAIYSRGFETQGHVSPRPQNNGTNSIVESVVCVRVGSWLDLVANITFQIYGYLLGWAIYPYHLFGKTNVISNDDRGQMVR